MTLEGNMIPPKSEPPPFRKAQTFQDRELLSWFAATAARAWFKYLTIALQLVTGGRQDHAASRFIFKKPSGHSKFSLRLHQQHSKSRHSDVPHLQWGTHECVRPPEEGQERDSTDLNGPKQRTPTMYPFKITILGGPNLGQAFSYRSVPFNSRMWVMSPIEITILGEHLYGSKQSYPQAQRLHRDKMISDDLYALASSPIDCA
ncbi:unnamed protein product [Citrullus colocynthis]|uniref:Uncharacterized protein n=1 Tax=Citrullus colocynthis TaxID=252529 RepID=A0ABP0Y3R1_9ROSI